MFRNLVFIRKAFNYFSENKNWILSILFIFSILKDCIWYACFGINILAYSSIQDTFISFFNYFIIFVIAPIIYVFLSVFPKKNVGRLPKIIDSVVKTSIFLILTGVYYFLFKKIISLLWLLMFIAIVKNYYLENKYLHLLQICMVFFVLVTMLAPLIHYSFILNKERDENGLAPKFNMKEDNMDFISFTYKNKLYNTKSNRFYLIGNNTNYFFLFDNKIDKSLIFPKSECEDIKSDVFILWDSNKD